MHRRSSWATLLAFLAMLAAGKAGAEQARHLDVVEMFTSQACSSCPPADRLLGELAQRDDVLALSYSVDYWDYLEWRDTLANPDFTARQRSYAKRRGDRSIYTPQAVMNGWIHEVGSDADAVKEAIAKSRRKRSEKEVPLSISRRDSSTVVIEAGGAPDGLTMPTATLWVVEYTDSRTVEIEAGENEGKSVTYYNVVRRISPVAEWKGEPVSVTVSALETEGRHSAVLLQEGSEEVAGRIISAARLE